MSYSVIAEIASAIHVRHIQTPMETARVFTRATRAGEVLAHMEAHQYDASPVFPDHVDDGAMGPFGPNGTLTKAEVQCLPSDGEIRSAVRPLTGSALIDGNASLVKLLERFREKHRFMMVVGGRGLEGIVTPSDMNKQAGRTHLFVQVSALEMALSDRVRAENWPDEETLRRLPQERARRAKSRLRVKREVDEAADLVAALDLEDLLRLAGASNGLDDFSALDARQIEGLATFRNKVVHAVLDPAGDADDRLEQLLTQTALITTLLDSLQSRSVSA